MLDLGQAVENARTIVAESGFKADPAQSGDAQLDVKAGGRVTSLAATVGRYAAGQGTALVEGAGSTWAVTGELTAGLGGEGTAGAVDGGKITSTSGVVGKNAGSLGRAGAFGIGLLASRQLKAVNHSVSSAAQQLAPAGASAPEPTGTVREQALRVQDQFKNDVTKALEQGARKDESDK